MSVSEPGKIITPWAESGLKNPIPPAANPATGRAGFDQGFSAINMTAKEAGGIPPFGQDFNGIFYEVTNILRYMQAGGQSTFDAALATATGGYPKGAMVLGDDGVSAYTNKVDSNSSNPNSGGSGWAREDLMLREALRRSYAEAGYNLVDGSFEAGGAVTTAIDVLLYEATGIAYAYSGTLPHAIGAGEIPVGNPLWVSKAEVTLLANLTTTGGASLIGCGPDINGGHPTVSDFIDGNAIPLSSVSGADPTGVASSSAALTAALATGRPVYLGGPENTWWFGELTSHTGGIVLYGDGATVKSDIHWLKVVDGSGSRVFGFNFYSKTVPYTIKRNTNTWVNSASDVVQSFDGYIPSPQDSDIWAAIPQAKKDHNAAISPLLLFTVSTALGGNGVHVSCIGGRQLCVVVEGYTDSSVSRNTFGGGQSTYAAIVFNNGSNRAYNSEIKLFSFPRGKGNCANDNKIKYATLCGAIFFGNDDWEMCRNTSTFNGESGLKTAQYDGVAGPTESDACMSTNGKVHGNTTSDNYFDGLDLQIWYPLIAYAYRYSGTSVIGNISRRNRFTGGHSNGASMIWQGNIIDTNGATGLYVIGTSNTVVGNHARNNCTTGTTLNPQVFDIAVQGDDCVTAFNNVENPNAPSTYNFIHTGLLGNTPTAGREGVSFGNNVGEAIGRAHIHPSISGSRSQLKTKSGISTSSLKSVTTAGYTIGELDYSLSFFTPAACTVVMPPPADNAGRILHFRNTNAFAIVSTAGNITQITGGVATSNILPATSGKWCELHCDGVTWQIVASN